MELCIITGLTYHVMTFRGFTDAFGAERKGVGIDLQVASGMMIPLPSNYSRPNNSDLPINKSSRSISRTIQARTSPKC